MTTAPPFFAFRLNMAAVPQHMFMNETGPGEGRDFSGPCQIGDGIPDYRIGHPDRKFFERTAPVNGMSGFPEIAKKSSQVHAIREG